MNFQKSSTPSQLQTIDSPKIK